MAAKSVIKLMFKIGYHGNVIKIILETIKQQ